MFEYRRVKRGVALLDKEIPGWAQFIDAGRLNLRKGSDCVLGQLYTGNYAMGEAVLFGDGSARRAGRLACRFGLDAGLGSTYVALTNEWEQIVLRRQYEAMTAEKACPALRKATQRA